jgi:hypothetical protein
MLKNRTIFSTVVTALFFVPLYPQNACAQVANLLPINVLDVTSFALSKLGAIGELTDQVLDEAIHGLGALVVNLDRDFGADGEMAGLNALPTGRLKWMSHDGYKSPGGSPFATSAFRSSETSAIVSGSLGGLRGIGGGQLMFSVFAGRDDVATKVSADKSRLTPPYWGDAVNRSFLFGGSGLYINGANYVMVTLAGAEGRTEQHGDGAEASYNVHGVSGSLVAGHVFDLMKTGTGQNRAPATPVKLDLRLGVGYQDSHGDQYVDPANGHRLRASLDSWTGVASVTLFSPFPLDGGAIFRPFVKGGARQQLSYDNRLSEEWDLLTETVSREVKFTQSDTSGVGEIGFDYVLPGVRFTAAVYGEKAADRENWGVRFGINVKLN